MSWYPGGTAAEATELEVRFAPKGDGTRVDLTHTGWEILGEKATETRGQYDGGWIGVLGFFETAANG